MPNDSSLAPTTAILRRVVVFLIVTVAGVFLFSRLGQQQKPRALLIPKREHQSSTEHVSRLALIPSAPRSHWYPTTCSNGAELQHDSEVVINGCKPDGDVLASFGPVWCQEVSKGVPTCGQYSEGLFPTKITFESLTLAWNMLREERTELCNKQEGWTMKQLSEPLVDVPSSYPFMLQNSACPSFRYFSPLEAMAILSHRANAGAGLKTILFSGDSLVRQLFLNVVALLRQEPVVVDYYSHADYIYIAYPSSDVYDQVSGLKDSTHCWVIMRHVPGLLKGKPRKPFYCPPPPFQKEEPVLVLYFMWDVTPALPRPDQFTLPVPLHIGGYFLWWYGSKDVSAADGPGGMVGAPVNVSVAPYLHQMQELLTAQRKRTFVWLTTPFLKDSHPLLAKLGSLTERNAKMRRWVTEGVDYDIPIMTSSTNEKVSFGIRGSKPPDLPQRHLLDLAEIVAAGKSVGIQGRSDGMHQSCGWLHSRPGPIVSLNGNGLQCRDSINAAAVQLLLHMLIKT